MYNSIVGNFSVCFVSKARRFLYFFQPSLFFRPKNPTLTMKNTRTYIEGNSSRLGGISGGILDEFKNLLKDKVQAQIMYHSCTKQTDFLTGN